MTRAYCISLIGQSQNSSKKHHKKWANASSAAGFKDSWTLYISSSKSKSLFWASANGLEFQALDILSGTNFSWFWFGLLWFVQHCIIVKLIWWDIKFKFIIIRVHLQKFSPGVPSFSSLNNQFVDSVRSKREDKYRSWYKKLHFFKTNIWIWPGKTFVTVGLWFIKVWDSYKRHSLKLRKILRKMVPIESDVNCCHV